MNRLLCQIDKKYSVNPEGKIYNVATGEYIPQDEPLFLLRARDVVSADTIEHYVDLCRENDCSSAHVSAASGRLAEFEVFARDHPDRMKLPGPNPEEAPHD